MPGAGAIRAGRAFVELFADSTGVTKELKQAETKFKAFGASLTSIGASLGGLGAAITAPLTGAVKMFADAGSTLHDMSIRTGVSVEALSALGYAASQSGTDIDAVELGIRKMQKAMTAGSLENQQAQLTFARLGLSIKQLMQLDPGAQFEQISSAISKIPNPTARAGAAMMIFGKTGTRLLPMIEELDQLTGEARQFGLVMSTDAANAADRLGDAMGLLGKVTGAITKSVGAALAPMFEEWSVSMARVGKQIMDFIKAHKEWVILAFKVGAGITVVATGLGALGAAAWVAGHAFGVLAGVWGLGGAALAALTSPILLVTAALGGLAAWFLTSTKAGKTFVTEFAGKFQALAHDAKIAFAGIADALKAGDISLAAQILWTELRVEWIKGVTALKNIWAEWGVSVVAEITKVSIKVRSIMIDLSANIESTFASVTSSLTSLFSELSKQAKGINVREAITAMGGGAGLALIDKAIAANKDEMAKAMKGAQAGAMAGGLGALAAPLTGVTLGLGGEEEQKRLADIESRRANAQKALADQEQTATEARKKAAVDAAAQAAGELIDEQQKLLVLRDQAKVKAEGVAAIAGKKPGAPGGEPEEPLTPEGLDQAMKQAKAKIDVAGSFSASALSGMGAAATFPQDQLKEQKQTNEHLKKIDRKLAVGQAVFT